LVRDEFIRGVLEVSAQGEWTVLVSSHDIEEVERLADHVAMLEAGRLRLSETTEALQARFRRVEITGAPEGAATMSEWLGWERAGALTRFVETQYMGEATERAWHVRFGEAAIVTRPMSLREIFMALTRESGRLTKEAIA